MNAKRLFEIGIVLACTLVGGVNQRAIAQTASAAASLQPAATESRLVPSTVDSVAAVDKTDTTATEKPAAFAAPAAIEPEQTEPAEESVPTQPSVAIIFPANEVDESDGSTDTGSSSAEPATAPTYSSAEPTTAITTTEEAVDADAEPPEIDVMPSEAAAIDTPSPIAMASLPAVLPGSTPTAEAPAGYVQMSGGVYVPREYIEASQQVEIAQAATPAAFAQTLRSVQQTSERNGVGLQAVYQRQVQAAQVAQTQTIVPADTASNAAPVALATAPTSASIATPVSIRDQSLLYPLPFLAPITSSYGQRWGRLHAGVDFGVPTGIPVIAAIAGQVSVAGWLRGYGYTVIVRANGIETLYAHLSQLNVRPGDSVYASQLIGRSGSSGNSTGPHLHLEVRTQDAAGNWRATNINQWAQAAQPGTIQTATTAQPTVAAAQISQLSTASSGVEMRVALEKDVPQLAIASSTTAAVTDTNGQPLGSIAPLQLFTVTRAGSQLRLNGQALPSVFFIQPDENGLVWVNNRWYRGRVLVAIRAGGLIAVNWVDLESYLASVVGGESYPNWNANALQAQAIAARSYALAHRYRPASPDWYDLDDTPRYQSYRGVEAEFNTTQAAVANTTGIVLTTSAGVLEAQYAATQAITDAAHDGVGMSQWGAASMAQQGQDWRSILNRYYPGAGLGRIAMGAPFGGVN